MTGYLDAVPSEVDGDGDGDGDVDDIVYYHVQKTPIFSLNTSLLRIAWCILQTSGTLDDIGNSNGTTQTTFNFSF